eukprot:scaffold4510_cov183-Amphora_coffeaeformis.AAC.27
MPREKNSRTPWYSTIPYYSTSTGPNSSHVRRRQKECCGGICENISSRKSNIRIAIHTFSQNQISIKQNYQQKQNIMINNNKSVLIIGATGALGLQCLRHLAKEASIAEVHVLCRAPSKLSDDDTRLCQSITIGDAKNTQDIEKALLHSKANYVILATGNGANVGKSDTREKTGQALAEVLSKPTYSHVKTVLVSSHGAADTKIVVGMGIGMMISYHLRHVLADHTNQEKAFASLMDRTLVVRPTALSDDKGGKTVVECEGNQKVPTINVDRSDVAAWITKEISKKVFSARVLSLTTTK